MFFHMALDWILARAVEPSTYAGVAGALIAAAHLQGGDVGTIEAFFAAAAGLVAMILKEKGVVV